MAKQDSRLVAQNIGVQSLPQQNPLTGIQNLPDIGTEPTPPMPLTPQQKVEWNNFIDFIDKKGLKGAPVLDDRNQKIGQSLFNEYKKMNPNVSIGYSDVPRVQQDLQNYRNTIVGQWRKNPSIIPDAKSEDQIMRNISQVDGWLGSKTSSHRFPTATATITNPAGKTTVKDYGTDVASFDKQFGKHGGK